MKTLQLSQVQFKSNEGQTSMIEPKTQLAFENQPENDRIVSISPCQMTFQFVKFDPVLVMRLRYLTEFPLLN